jgi:hypothetical protein
MAYATRVFKPVDSKTVTIAVTAASAATALATSTIQYRLYNAGAGTVFFNFGDSGATAAVASATPIAPGNTEIFTPKPGVTHIATIGSAGATLYVTPGEGF